jgi:hypothetical protein
MNLNFMPLFMVRVWLPLRDNIDAHHHPCILHNTVSQWRLGGLLPWSLFTCSHRLYVCIILPISIPIVWNPTYDVRNLKKSIFCFLSSIFKNTVHLCPSVFFEAICRASCTNSEACFVFHNTLTFSVTYYHFDRLCGLVVRVLGYRSGGPGSIPGTTRGKKSNGSGTGSTQPRVYNWGATW